MGLSDARLTLSFGKKGRGWSGCWRKRGRGREAAVPALLVITLDLLVMLMSCWVIAHVYAVPGWEAARPSSLKRGRWQQKPRTSRPLLFSCDIQ